MNNLNSLLDAAALSANLRALSRYAANRIEGLQYGSYKLEDEVALARSFMNPSRGQSGGLVAVVDAGANSGDWSRSFLECKPPYEKLMVIEPQAIHMESLRKLQLDSNRVVVEQTAIGSEPGVLPIYADADGSGLASLYQRDLTHIGARMEKQELVTVTTLDMLSKQHGIDRISFLKLDLEGHELEALKGARNLLDQCAIDALAFEFGGCNIDSRTYMKDFWNLLVLQHEFSLYRLLPKRRLKRLLQYSESLEQFSWQNILACAPGITPSWKALD